MTTRRDKLQADLQHALHEKQKNAANYEVQIKELQYEVCVHFALVSE